MLRTALIAATGVFSLWGAIGSFALSVLIAVAVGGVTGFGAVFIRSRIGDPVITTSISFAVPFVAYLPAEELNASGVLAVVVAGLATGHRGLRRLSSQDRQTETTVWSTVQFLLENGVFLMMGLQLPALLARVEASDGRVAGAFAVAGVVLLVIVAVRAIACSLTHLADRLRPNRAARQREQIAGYHPVADQTERSRCGLRREGGTGRARHGGDRLVGDARCGHPGGGSDDQRGVPRAAGDGVGGVRGGTGHPGGVRQHLAGPDPGAEAARHRTR